MADEKTPKINVKQAVRAAMAFVAEVYSGEKISNVGLEEVKFDEGEWLVTVGFSRPWDYPKIERPIYDVLAVAVGPRRTPSPDRDYKVVRVDATTGEVLGMAIREEE